MEPRALIYHGSRISLLMLFVMTVVGCAETGDFGRRRPGLFEGKQGLDGPSDWFGSRATLTDNEIEFRNRAMAFSLNPEKSIYPSLDAFEFAIGSDPDLYFSRVAGHSDLSVTSRYKRVERDALADLALVPLFRSAACRVARDDAMRLRAMTATSNLSDAQRWLATDRVASNAAIGRAVEHAMGQRVDAYHSAVERLYAASPDQEAKPTVEAIALLRAEVEKGDACGNGSEPQKSKHLIRKG